jgi:hypothetical protein
VAVAISILLVVVGAILVWGIDADVAGFDVEVAGWISMAVGFLGAAFSLVASARAPRKRPTRRDYIQS